MNTEYGRVVAGVSALDARPATIRWAADEAARRDAELLLVTAVPPRAAPEQYLPSDAADGLRDSARAGLTRAAGHAAAWRPGLSVSTELLAGPPAEVLRHAGASADLLVIGADDQSPFAEAITGSVPGSLLTTAPCPLVVVPQAEPVSRATAPVLLALDEPGTAQSAVIYAFAAADRSGRGLHVLHCVPAGAKDHADRHEPARALIGIRELYPRVEVTQETAVGDPRDVLVERSRSASLLVLGSRGHGRFASTLFGSVGRELIRRSGCPVVVARPRPGDLNEGAVS